MFSIHFLFYLENLVAVVIYTLKRRTVHAPKENTLSLTIVLSLSLNSHTHPSHKARNQVLVFDFFDSLRLGDCWGKRRKEKEEKKRLLLWD